MKEPRLGCDSSCDFGDMIKNFSVPLFPRPHPFVFFFFVLFVFLIFTVRVTPIV